MDIYRRVLPVEMENPWGGDPSVTTTKNRGVVIVNTSTVSEESVVLESQEPNGQYIEFTVYVKRNSTLTIPVVVSSVVSTSDSNLYVYEIF